MLNRAIADQRPGALIVEDDTLLMMDAMDLAEEAGLVAYGARNAEEAIRVLNNHSGIRLLFTDVHMSGSMDGVALAETVRREWPPVAIMLTSGVRELPHSDLPSDSLFFSKPYRPQSVIQAMSAAVAEAA